MLVAVSASEAREFVSKRHYSGSASSGTVRYGWQEDGELLGVTIYNNGTHQMRAGVFGEEHSKRVLHHHRLALDPSAPKFTATKFIGASLRAIQKDHPNLWAVVTYADSCQAHHGTIYQATNAIYTGVVAKGNLKFLTPEGVIVPTQSLKGTWPERRAQARELGWQEIRCKGKHRYVYLLGSTRAQKKRGQPPLLWDVLPYPK